VRDGATTRLDPAAVRAAAKEAVPGLMVRSGLA